MIFSESFITNNGYSLFNRATSTNKSIVWGSVYTSSLDSDGFSDEVMHAMTSADFGTYTSSGSVTSSFFDTSSNISHIYCDLNNRTYDGVARTIGIWAKIQGDSQSVLVVVARCGTGTVPTTINPISRGLLRVQVDVSITFTDYQAQSIEVISGYYAPAQALQENNNRLSQIEGDVVDLEDRVTVLEEDSGPDMTRFVSCHTQGSATTGDPQTIYGVKTFKNDIKTLSIVPDVRSGTSMGGVIGNQNIRFSDLFVDNCNTNTINSATTNYINIQSSLIPLSNPDASIGLGKKSQEVYHRSSDYYFTHAYIDTLYTHGNILPISSSNTSNPDSSIGRAYDPSATITSPTYLKLYSRGVETNNIYAYTYSTGSYSGTSSVISYKKRSTIQMITSTLNLTLSGIEDEKDNNSNVLLDTYDINIWRNPFSAGNKDCIYIRANQSDPSNSSTWKNEWVFATKIMVQGFDLELDPYTTQGGVQRGNGNLTLKNGTITLGDEISDPSHYVRLSHSSEVLSSNSYREWLNVSAGLSAEYIKPSVGIVKGQTICNIGKASEPFTNTYLEKLHIVNYTASSSSSCDIQYKDESVTSTQDLWLNVSGKVHLTSSEFKVGNSSNDNSNLHFVYSSGSLEIDKKVKFDTLATNIIEGKTANQAIEMRRSLVPGSGYSVDLGSAAYHYKNTYTDKLHIYKVGNDSQKDYTDTLLFIDTDNTNLHPSSSYPENGKYCTRLALKSQNNLTVTDSNDNDYVIDLRYISDSVSYSPGSTVRVHVGALVYAFPTYLENFPLYQLTGTVIRVSGTGSDIIDSATYKFSFSEAELFYNNNGSTYWFKLPKYLSKGTYRLLHAVGHTALGDLGNFDIPFLLQKVSDDWV